MKTDLNKKEKMVLQLINQLTDSEDHRSDLWIAYLSGTPLSRLNNTLKNKTISSDIEQQFAQQIQSIIDNPPPQEFLGFFTETEREILCLLSLGCNLDIISKYNGTSEVILNQIMVGIRENKAWKLHGIKATI